MYQLYFYVPLTHKETVKNALFDIGVGKIGNYDACSFESHGVGQFRANDKANPFIGSFNKIEKVEEIKVEMILSESLKDKAVKTLKKFHPYEEPAYGCLKIFL